MLFGAAGQAGTMAILAGTAYLAQGGNNGAAIAAGELTFSYSLVAVIENHGFSLAVFLFVSYCY